MVKSPVALVLPAQTSDADDRVDVDTVGRTVRVPVVMVVLVSDGFLNGSALTECG